MIRESLRQAFTRVLGFLTPVRALLIAAVVAFFWWFILGDQGVYQLRRLIEMQQRLVEDREELNDAIDDLEQEHALLRDPKNLEMVIRQELGFIRPGEIVFEEQQGTENEKPGSSP